MDDFFLTSDDIEDIVRTNDTFARRKNKDPQVIRGIILCGTSGYRQGSPLAKALDVIAKKFGDYGIAVRFDELSNDTTKKLRWDVTKYFDNILTYDFHIFAGYVHFNMVGTAGPSWTMRNINKEITRLKWHPGIPGGRRLGDAVWRKDKIVIHQLLKDYSLPFVAVRLTERGVSPSDLEKLTR